MFNGLNTSTRIGKQNLMQWAWGKCTSEDLFSLPGMKRYPGGHTVKYIVHDENPMMRIASDTLSLDHRSNHQIEPDA